jgi:hypothetical protein
LRWRWIKAQKNLGKVTVAPAGGTYRLARAGCRSWRGRSTRKYLRMKAFSRPSSGPPQLMQCTLASTGDRASTFTNAYFAVQWGHWNGLVRNLSVMERAPN